MRDETIQCVDCGRTFVWSFGEQRYFKEHEEDHPCPKIKQYPRAERGARSR